MVEANFETPPTSLSTAAARNLATTTKTQPQMLGITPRWLLKMLPWVQVAGGIYRVNRRLRYTAGDGRVSFVSTGAKVEVIPQELCELPLLRGFADLEALAALAGRFVQREVKAGELLVQAGTPAEHIYLLAHGKANKLRPGKFDDPVVLSVLTDGDHFGDETVVSARDHWSYTVQAVTPCTVLLLSEQGFQEILAQSRTLQAQVEQFKARRSQPQDKHGQAQIAMATGHHGEAYIPGTFVDYELHPREYALSLAQTRLQVHTRVMDLYNGPMNQLQQQVRLTIHALRERQEYEMLNHREFGLLHNADLSQRISTRSGPPTPEDMDEILCRRRKSRFFLAHPKAITALGRECNRRGIYPLPVEMQGRVVHGWRGVPILPSDKIPISETGTTSILVMRTGEEDQGVVGLHQTGIPDEVEPSLSVRFMGINEKAIVSYLVTAYYSAAVLIPDALGILENVEIGR